MPLAQPTYKMAPFAGSGPPSGSFTPAQIQQAYQFNQVSYNGSDETIAIVDAYNDPDIQSDLNTFDTEFGLPSTTISVVNETGGSKLPSADPTGGWEVEESLDVEWAHAMAPGANIMLVEASSASLSDLLTAVSYASQHANVVSMSWGSSEFSGETSDDSYFNAPGVAFVVASGDTGAPAEWPATSPNVLGVGGTSLTLNSSGGWGSETGWSGSTGGPSAYEPQPSYQAGVVTQTSTARATPDVAYDASSTGTYAVYDSYPDEGETLDWVAVYGTSAGAPQWSAILAIADQGRAANGLSALNSSSAQQVMDILYQNPGDFHDITSGTSTGNPEYSAGPGYDYVTGLGTPMVNLVVGSLDGSTSTSPPDTMVVSAPSSATAGDLVHLYRHRREPHHRKRGHQLHGDDPLHQHRQQDPGLAKHLHVHHGQRWSGHLHRHARDRRLTDDHRDERVGVGHLDDHGQPRRGEQVRDLRPLDRHGGDVRELHRDCRGRLRQRGHRLYRHRGVHQLRHRGDPAGQHPVHLGQCGHADVLRHLRDGRNAVVDRHRHRSTRA